jgi:hypothetical protein
MGKLYDFFFRMGEQKYERRREYIESMRDKIFNSNNEIQTSTMMKTIRPSQFVSTMNTLKARDL